MLGKTVKGGTAALITSLFAASAAAQSINVDYPNGVTRTVDCKEAFYVFRDDPNRTKWYTCDGFEAVDEPLTGNKSDPQNRDAICSMTDSYNPAQPASINDPNYSKIRGDFSDAMLEALAHVSTNHDESVMPAINMRARTGVDVFAIYDHVIRRASSTNADGQISTGEYYAFQPGWNSERANRSAYGDTVKACEIAGFR